MLGRRDRGTPSKRTRPSKLHTVSRCLTACRIEGCCGRVGLIFDERELSKDPTIKLVLPSPPHTNAESVTPIRHKGAVRTDTGGSTQEASGMSGRDDKEAGTLSDVDPV